MGSFAASALDWIRSVPEGRVVTYGQVAALAGRPGSARQVGYLLAALDDGSDVPWHRVVNSRGEISRRADGSGIPEGYQRHLLTEEGVGFGDGGRIDLEMYLWEPSLDEGGRR